MGSGSSKPKSKKNKLKKGAARYPANRTSAVTKVFPGALPADEWLAAVKADLASHGFTEDAIALANYCRDEATDGLRNRIDNAFHDSFNINGLGGVLTCGSTGIKAGLSHAPISKAGKENYIFFSFPHTSVDSSGGLGKIQRPGRAGVSHACGALIAALGEFQSKGLSGQELSLDDLEYSVLKTHLVKALQEEGITDDVVRTWDLAQMTKFAERSITQDLEDLIRKTVDTSKANYAVVTGVQIHSWPIAGDSYTTQLDYVWPRTGYVVVNGTRRELDIANTGAQTQRQSWNNAPGLAPATAPAGNGAPQYT